MTTNTAAAILNRLIDPETGSLSPEAARSLVQLDFPAADHARMSELSSKAQEGALTEDEGEELDEYIRVADLLGGIAVESAAVPEARRARLDAMDADLERRVRERAGRACEYCRLPQAPYRFHFPIDHIIARQHGGKTLAANLCLACPRCNRNKGPNIAGVDPATGKMVRLFHPRRHKWSAHFAWIGPSLRGKTAIGRTTIRVLAVNHPSAVAVREALIAEGAFPPS